MWLFLFLLLFCTQITYNHQKYSKIGEVAIGAALGPVFQVFRENETFEISENKQELISDAKSPGQIFIVNFIDKYAQNQLAKTQELTPHAEQTSKKIENYYKRWTNVISFVHDVCSLGGFQLLSHQGQISTTIISRLAKNPEKRNGHAFCSLKKNMETYSQRNFPKSKPSQPKTTIYFKVAKAINPDNRKNGFIYLSRQKGLEKHKSRPDIKRVRPKKLSYGSITITYTTTASFLLSNFF
jgi:hypothetical protein